MAPRSPVDGHRKYKIMLVDDHTIVRDGLTMMLQQEKDFVVCGSFDDAATALREAATLRPDVAILEVSLAGISGLELTKTLRARFPMMRILILSMHKEFLYAERMLRAGANGYVTKHQGRKELVDAVRRVLQGGTHVSDEIKEIILMNVGAKNHRGGSTVDSLSDREFEIFQLIARGYGTRQIAESLNLSMKTVETHREHIREKINLKSTFELVQYALEWSSSQRL